MWPRNCFWDGYWGRASQLLAISLLSLVTVPEIFAKINSIHLLVSKAAKSVSTPLFSSDYTGQQ